MSQSNSYGLQHFPVRTHLDNFQETVKTEEKKTELEQSIARLTKKRTSIHLLIKKG